MLLNRWRHRTNENRCTLEELSPEIKVKLPPSKVELLQFPDSALSFDSPFYIKRSLIEDPVCAELQQPGCLIRIKAPRHFGKTSLLNRLLIFAYDKEYKLVYLDFQEADETVFTSLNQFLGLPK